MNVFCRERVRFRSIEDDLVDEATFSHRDVLLPELGVVPASTPIERRLGKLRRTLDARFDQMNGRPVWRKVRDEADPIENKPLFDAVERIDQHINFYGRYRFEPEGQPVDLAAMASGIGHRGVDPRASERLRRGPAAAFRRFGRT